MKLLKQPNDSCHLYSLAMVLDAEPAALIKEIGHTGQECWWPELLPSVICKRGINIQEIIDCCLSRGWAMVPIMIAPCNAPQGQAALAKPIWSIEEGVHRFQRILKGRRGVMIGQLLNGAGHACAWGDEKIYDPRGMIYDLKSTGDFCIKECWVLYGIKS